MKSARVIFFVFIVLAMAAACKKSDTISNAQPPVFKISYGDSVFYINSQATDYLVNPVNGKPGSFTSFPEGLAIDKTTGTINVSKSEAGMRYRINFLSSAGDTSSTYIVISGINFPDKYYFLANSDSIAFPVYNADPSLNLPSGSFDEDKSANKSGCAMKTINGQINLTESLRNGLFGNNPQNNTKKGFDVLYRLNDKSGNSLNKISILIYYFNTMNDVTPDLAQTVIDHQIMTLQPNHAPIANGLIQAASKPRPPCIVIIGH
ncbi:MAG TPA: hypothetical protein VGO09_04800 [Flavisolibacter sp.]|nr:hypothetical protein [Flavisolibacter sp.]